MGTSPRCPVKSRKDRTTLDRCRTRFVTCSCRSGRTGYSESHRVNLTVRGRELQLNLNLIASATFYTLAGMCKTWDIYRLSPTLNSLRRTLSSSRFREIGTRKNCLIDTFSTYSREDFKSLSTCVRLLSSVSEPTYQWKASSFSDFPYGKSAIRHTSMHGAYCIMRGGYRITSEVEFRTFCCQ
ncbi:hypothetical protein EDD15DRAFT_2229552 [Pisolithus albus]|nr:hypothetical protein EDD15DRAFT_2229552 [Pisolithus albus]